MSGRVALYPAVAGLVRLPRPPAKTPDGKDLTQRRKDAKDLATQEEERELGQVRQFGEIRRLGRGSEFANKPPRLIPGG